MQKPALPFLICEVESASSRTDALVRAFSSDHAAALLLDAHATMTEKSLSALVQAWRIHPRAVLGGRIVDARWPQRVQLPGWRWSEAKGVWQPDWMIEIKADPAAPEVLPCVWLNPEILLVPRDAWEVVGGFDPRIDPPLAVIDWCLRARKAGFQCYEVQTAFALKQILPTERRGPWGPTHLSDLPGMLILAGKHQLPTRRMRLAWLFMHKAISEELGRVRYWADYGSQISLFKRTVWYVRNLVLAIKRARIPAMILGMLRHLISTPPARNSP
jgi:hypothetical protein